MLAADATLFAIGTLPVGTLTDSHEQRLGAAQAFRVPRQATRRAGEQVLATAQPTHAAQFTLFCFLHAAGPVATTADDTLDDFVH